ncbi:condensation domain-containing protein [Streptomyces sp. NPDC046915]|uniref:condensation domain-containing protein n=1 Tax=Streptomyces sp. NPDC046915 TaxID=3155257 RepID=UPI0033CFD55D
MSGDRFTGVCAVLDPERGERYALELHGPLDVAVFHRALHRIAESHPGRRLAPPRLLRHGPGRHTVELPADEAGSAPYPVGLLTDLLTARPDPVTDGRPGPGPAGGAGARPCGTLPRTQPVTPLQQARLADALARPDHHVEQLVWRWYGPLDTARFTAAWQAVTDRESVLRTAFVWDPRPRAVVFDHGLPDVTRHDCPSTARRAALRARERARPFDLRRPGLLRVALLDGQVRGRGDAGGGTAGVVDGPAEWAGEGRTAGPGPAGGWFERSADGWREGDGKADAGQGGGAGPGGDTGACTDVLITYHRALLDSWSVRLLMRECCRAYLAGGMLPGGERRPDLGDCARWLAGRDLGPARDFWGRGARPAPGAGPPAPLGSGGTGLYRTALSPAETALLARWAAYWGVAESSVLQAAWAMLLYRSCGAAPGAAAVGFGLGFPGRGLLLEGIEGTPGPFENALPMSVVLDPALTVPGLLRELRDRAVDMAAYEWVAGADSGGGGAPASRAGGLLAFDCGPRPQDAFGDALAAQGLRVEEQEVAGALTGYAVGVRAGHDARRGLALTCAYDRDVVDGGAARVLLAQTARLLRLLPRRAGAATTVGDALQWLSGAVVPRVPEGAGSGAGRPAPPLVPLRPAAVDSAATVCLVDVPGAPRTGHWELVRHYLGPEALTALRLTAAEGGPRAAAALGALARSGTRLVLGGYSGAGALACELARRVAAQDVPPPLVVIGGGPDDPDGARHLAHALRAACA